MGDYLSKEQIAEVRDAALLAFGATENVRQFLFEGINPMYVGILQRYPAPLTQIHSDLLAMNRVSRLSDGSVPLRDWLHNAAGLTSDSEIKDVFARTLDLVDDSASGRPDLGNAVSSAETQERVIFRDDTVTFGFLAQGAAAGQSVARILVTPYENGQPRLAEVGRADPHAGTCWLAGPGVLITNHHVLNARSAGVGMPKPLAAEADLAEQAGHAVVWFDYDESDSKGTEFTGTDLLAWSTTLDYAILRMWDDPGRPPLPSIEQRLSVGVADNVAVNVIQHPYGGAKRVGLRNNLVHDTTVTDLRYFTDTKEGASGSPVLTDLWKVCALHRGSRKVDVEFQGKKSAYINVGTQMGAVLEDVKDRFPDVYTTLTSH